MKPHTRILLYNCFDALGNGLARLFLNPLTSVYLAISQNDIFRLLDDAEIGLAIINSADLDQSAIAQFSDNSVTKFVLFDGSATKTTFCHSERQSGSSQIMKTIQEYMQQGEQHA